MRLRQKDKTLQDIFFVVPGDGLALLGISDIELLGILKIMCEVLGSQQADRKFNSKMIQLYSALSCKANTDWEINSDNVDVIDANSSMQNYCWSNMDRAADKRAGQVLMKIIQNEFSDDFFRNWMF